MDLAFSDGDDNPVPAIKRLNELKTAASSEENIATAFACMRERLNGIDERVRDKGFIEKAAEYYKNGYSLFVVTPMNLDGHKFGLGVCVGFEGMLTDWTEEQLAMAGIKMNTAGCCRRPEV